MSKEKVPGPKIKRRDAAAAADATGAAPEPSGVLEPRAPAPASKVEAQPEPEPVTAAEPEPQSDPEPNPAAVAPPPGIDMAAAPHEVDVMPAPSIPAGEAPDRPTRPEAPLVLPPTAPPPMGQVAELASELASLEPPEAVFAEPMAPAPREAVPAESDGQPSLPIDGLEPSPHVTAEPEVARPSVAATVMVEPPATTEPEPAPTPLPDREQPAARRPKFEDAVTLLEISPPEAGGAREAALPGDRSGSPPSPLPARRIGWNHPVARWTAYGLVVVALTLVFLWLMISLFRIA